MTNRTSKVHSSRISIRFINLAREAQKANKKSSLILSGTKGPNGEIMLANEIKFTTRAQGASCSELVANQMIYSGRAPNWLKLQSSGAHLISALDSITTSVQPIGITRIQFRRFERTSNTSKNCSFLLIACRDCSVRVVAVFLV